MDKAKSSTYPVQTEVAGSCTGFILNIFSFYYLLTAGFSILRWRLPFSPLWITLMQHPTLSEYVPEHPKDAAEQRSSHKCLKKISLPLSSTPLIKNSGELKILYVVVLLLLVFLKDITHLLFLDLILALDNCYNKGFLRNSLFMASVFFEVKPHILLHLHHNIS